MKTHKALYFYHPKNDKSTTQMIDKLSQRFFDSYDIEYYDITKKDNEKTSKLFGINTYPGLVLLKDNESVWKHQGQFRFGFISEMFFEVLYKSIQTR